MQRCFGRWSFYHKDAITNPIKIGISIPNIDALQNVLALTDSLLSLDGSFKNSTQGLKLSDRRRV